MTMKIDHAASWVCDLKRACSFYERWFEATKGPKYSSTKRPFTSYCLSLGSGARLTLGELSFRTSLPCRTSLAAHAKRLWYQESTGEFSSCGRSYHSGDVHHLYTAIVLT